MDKDIKFMKEAIKEAKKAYNKGEVPVGAIIVKDGKIIARGHNTIEEKQDATKHAEIIAIQKASRKLGAWRLLNCSMYVTLEPCSMCAGAIIQSRIENLYIGTMEPRSGACGSMVNLTEEYNKVSKINVVTGICKNESEKILKDFFKMIRKK